MNSRQKTRKSLIDETKAAQKKDEFSAKDAITLSEKLKEVDELKNLISKQKPALICCGHLHQNIEVIEGETRVFSTASASNRLNASYRIFDIEQIDQESAAWSIRMQRKTINPINGKIEVKNDKTWDFRF